MKRTRKLILALVVVMSLLMAMAVAVIPASAATISGGAKLYLIPNTWDAGSARFAAYFFNGSSNKWVDMSDTNGDGIYEVEAPTGNWNNVIFCRMNSSTTENNWDNKWNQTGNLTFDSSKPCYVVSGWGENDGAWIGSTGGDRYVAGTLGGGDWNVKGHKMVIDDTTQTYTMTYYNVKAGEYQFKVTNGTWDSAYPSSNYVVNLTSDACKVVILYDSVKNSVTATTTVDHKDANFDHVCDNGCGVAQGTHADSDIDKDHVCDYGCGETLEQHTGGTATCTDKPVCEICNNEYGSALGHKDADKNHVCDNGCGIAQGTHEENDSHTCTYCGIADEDWVCRGGTATCTAQAECEVCGTAYGELAAHTPGEDDGDCTTAINCSACSAVTTEGKASHTSSEDDGDVTTAVKCANEGCEHVFVEAKEAITLTIPTFENGTVTQDKINYAIDDTVTLTIAPNGGYFQKLTIDGEPLLLGWKATTYSFVAEKDTYVIGGSFERTLEMYAGDWGRWDNTNHAHGILSAYYPNNNDAWWVEFAGNYDSLSINAKNYREIANSYEGGPDGGWRIVLYMQLDDGKYYAFSMWIDTEQRYAYNHYGGNVKSGTPSATGWGGAWCLLSEKNAEATAALNGDGAEFKLERIDGNHIQITFGGTVLETYEIPGATAANKVKTVGLLHYGNKGARVDIPFELTVPCDHNTADCPHVLVGDEYKTVEDAFKSETTADITLNKDFVVPEGGLTTGGAILLGDGVTLNLNGQNLTAAGVVNFGGAKIVGEGLIVVGENKLIGKSADYLALWTTDGEVSGYALKEVKDLYKGGSVTPGEGETNKYTVEFRPAFLDGSHFGTFSVAGHGVAFSVKITAEGMADIIVPVGADVIQKVYDEKRVMKLNLKNAELNKTYNIYLVMTSGQAEYVDSLGTITNGTYAK